ncbi:uncharacterized protein LOC125529033 [Triticum urartu]|uniref:CCHC-type domain-containing protein n=1 Tax=Triticum urartu TaxID=4572 RepID=A0A8R7VCK9_TRIUA|nr:uncharacterized protein LOC125529033 [Triticum urartu]
METNGLSIKSQETGSKRKWETNADLSRRFCTSQHESPWEGGAAKHITCHSSEYQGQSSQECPPWNYGSLTTSPGKQKDFRFCSNQHKSPWEGGTTEHIAWHSSWYRGHSSQEWPTRNGASLTPSLGRQNDFRFCSNQHTSPWEGGTTEHIACHPSWYQGHSSQEWPTRNGGSLTPSPERNDFHVSGGQFFLTFNPYEQDVESRYLQDKKNGVITCLVCGKEGHYSSKCRFKDQEHRIICTVCGKNGHCSMWCCQQNKSENRACTRCGEIGHSTSTHGLSCSSCDEHHDDGECRLSEVKCFICECQDHYLAQCPLNSVLTEAVKGQRDNFQAALRLALSKQGNPSSTPAKCSAKSEGKVLTANNSSPIVTAYNASTTICFTCREEGHFAFQCPQNSPGLCIVFEESGTIATSANLSKKLEEWDPDTGTAKQSSEMKPILYDRCCPSKAKVLPPNKSSPMVRTCKTKTKGKKKMCYTCREEGHYARMCPQSFGAISGNTSKELEESSTIPTSSNMSKVLEEQDPGTAKQSSEMKPASIVQCVSCGQEGHRARSCPTVVFTCYKCNEEGHTANDCRQNQSSEMKPASVVRCVSCGQEGHRAKRCPTVVFTCYKCNEEGHSAKNCPQNQSSEMKPKSNVYCVSCGQEGHMAKRCPTRVFTCFRCNEEGHIAKNCPQKR